MKLTITIDSDKDEDFVERSKTLLDAHMMGIRINDFIGTLRYIYKHKELSEDQNKLLEEIKELYIDHFEEFLKD